MAKATQATQRAIAQQRFTRTIDFKSINPDGDLLFSVRAGLSVNDALETASCYMAAACESVAGLAAELSDEGHGDRVWIPYYLVCMAKAVLDSCTERVSQEGGAV